MSCLLDTCVLSELRRPEPDAGLLEWISTVDEDRLWMSVLTLGEIEQGIARLQPGRRHDTLQHWLEQT